LLNQGGGTFEPVINYGAGISPQAVAVADFDSDGAPWSPLASTCSLQAVSLEQVSAGRTRLTPPAIKAPPGAHHSCAGDGGGVRSCLASWYNRLYSEPMKTAISLPDDLFEEVEACARRMRLSRSALLALAARQFVANQRRHPDPTRAWNDAIAAAGQPGDDPAATAMRRRSKAIVRGRR